jgi:hypothetical protein
LLRAPLPRPTATPAARGNSPRLGAVRRASPPPA